MMLMTECPEFPQALSVLPGCTTLDGQVLENLLDEPPGPWLAVVLADIDPTRLTSLELPAYLAGWQKQVNWAEANLTAGVAELAHRTDVEIPDKEVALALCEPAGTASRRVWAALRVTGRLPKIWQAFKAGHLTRRHVDEVVKRTNRVDDPDLLDQLQDRVLARAAGKTVEQLGRHTRDTLRDLDPAGAQQRAKAARDEQTDVVLYPADDDGIADVVATLPVEDAAIVTAATDAYAYAAKNAGDPRRIGVLRGEGITRMASAYLTGDTGPGAAPTSGRRPIEIGIVTDLPTALGLTDLPGEVPGKGMVPRDVIAELIAREQPKLRLMVINEHSGRLLYQAAEGYRPRPEQIAQVRATYVTSVGPSSQVPADRCDTDHPVPYPHGQTIIGNLAPLDRNWHGDKTRKHLTVTMHDDGTITVATPLGQTRTVEPYDYRPCKTTPPTSPDVAKTDVVPDPTPDTPPPF